MYLLRNLQASLEHVQRLFSMFPQGGPGLALFLLRVSVAESLYYGAASRLLTPSLHWMIWCLVFVAGMLALGLLTPVCSVVACFAFTYFCANAMAPERYIFLAFALSSLALCLLGPGAYSLDGGLFGRRVVVFPRREDSESSNSE